METRLLGAALGRKRGTVAIAVLAVAIGASVASALLHVSGDVSHKLDRELRALGPNVLVVPADAASARSTAPTRAWETASGGFLDERQAGERISAAKLDAAPLLFVVAQVNGQTVQIVGSDLTRIRALHPSWKTAAAANASLIGARLARRLGLHEGQPVTVTARAGGTSTLAAGSLLEAGGADDEAWWIDLREAQRLAHLDGQVSLFEAHVEGGADRVRELGRKIDTGDFRLLPIGALSAAEAELLARTQRLMLLVTAAALVAAGLCAFGTLTDLALERRREIALMKALGAGAREVARQFAIESMVIGLAGGIVGWLFGLGMAQVIGSQVFHSVIAVRWDVPPLVLALSMLVAAVASLGPIRLALAIAPAAALKGE